MLDGSTLVAYAEVYQGRCRPRRAPGPPRARARPGLGRVAAGRSRGVRRHARRYAGPVRVVPRTAARRAWFRAAVGPVGAGCPPEVDARRCRACLTGTGSGPSRDRPMSKPPTTSSRTPSPEGRTGQSSYADWSVPIFERPGYEPWQFRVATGSRFIVGVALVPVGRALVWGRAAPLRRAGPTSAVAGSRPAQRGLRDRARPRCGALSSPPTPGPVRSASTSRWGWLLRRPGATWPAGCDWVATSATVSRRYAARRPRPTPSGLFQRRCRGGCGGVFDRL